MGKGSKRLRTGSWQLRAYAGINPATGGQETISLTLPPVDGRPVPQREADEALAKLIARAARLRDERQDVRRLVRVAEVLGSNGSSTRPEGYVVRFNVEMIYDSNLAGEAYDFVGTYVACQCGESVQIRDLDRHARTHEPGSGS